MSRNQRSTERPLGRATKTIGSLIGLAGEALAHRKEKKALQQEQDSTATIATAHDDASEDAQIPDEEDWILDAASDDLSSDVQAADAISMSLPLATIVPLPYPVILPQRRPQSKSRGFVNAYAPLLGSCKGIDEATFLNFLATFHKETQASDYWQVLNVGAMAVGNVPSVIAMAVAMTAGATANAGIAVQSRYRTNSFLDKANLELFHPVNVHAMIMTFRPARAGQPVIMDIDVNTHNTALVEDLKRREDPHMTTKLMNSSGKARGEWEIPEAAPLIYPRIDKAASMIVAEQGIDSKLPQHGAEEQLKQSNVFKRSTAFVHDYLDRRAQAEYAGVQGADSKLAVPGAKQENWATRFADPNHPANAGSIAALLTGGKFDPRAQFRGRIAEVKASKTGRTLSEQEKSNIAMRRGGEGDSRGPIRKGLKKVMAEDVLYLVIAEMPSTEQMVEMRRQWEGKDYLA